MALSETFGSFNTLNLCMSEYFQLAKRLNSYLLDFHRFQKSESVLFLLVRSSAKKCIRVSILSLKKMKFFLFESLLGFFKRCQKAWNSFFCKPKKLKTHESNFYEAVKLSKSLKTASKDPVLVPGKCSSFWTESGQAPIPKHCT